jgi:hypothetical protein
VSVVGFAGERVDGSREWGGMLVVGLALDRIAQGPVHVASDRATPAYFAADSSAPSPAPSASTPAPSAAAAAAASASKRPLAALLARGTVRAALRASGLDADDARIDEMIARAHASAALPETRLRAMRLVNDAQHTSTTAVDDTGRVYDATGANLWLEARLTWRLDRLLYADDEPTLERVRLERQDARARVAARVLELLFAWQRAQLDAESAPAASRAEIEAELRSWEAQIALDVMTAGWFGKQPGVAQ